MSTRAATAVEGDVGAGVEHRRRLRPDIEGLRAIAVLLVIVYHVGIPWVRGGFIGVDIFFVVSGYLITGLLLREAQREGHTSLVRFFARRARRLLPAATLVLVATAAATIALAPASMRGVFGWDISASALNVANWRFARRSVDYLAEGDGPSPVLHFWSLGVEEQFYLLWPLLIALALAFALRKRESPRRAAAMVLGAVLVVSFAWSVVGTERHPAQSFFTTTTRLWELAIGAMVAIAAARLSGLGPRLSACLALSGLVLIGASAVLFSDATPWPGAAALVPVLGAAAVIIAGIGGSNAVSRVVGTRPFVVVGGLSYSLYLWHWPVLVVGTQWLGHDRVRWAIVLACLSVIPAWLSKRLIEDPVRFSTRLAPPKRALTLGAALIAIGALAGATVAYAAPKAELPTPGAEIEIHASEGTVTVTPADRGAGAIVDGEPFVLDTSPDSITPEPANAATDLPSPFADDCQTDFESSTPLWCPMGLADGETTFVVVGDSKAAQWGEAIDAAATALGWSGTEATKSACSFTAAVMQHEGDLYTTCNDFNTTVLAELTAHPPDFVITSQRVPMAAADESSDVTVEAAVSGLVEMWTALEALGIQVIVIVDNPTPPLHAVFDCVDANREDISECSFDAEKGRSRSAAPTQLAAVEQVPGVQVIDLVPAICPDGTCPAVIGDVLVYRKGSHITRSYAATLAPRMFDALAHAS